MFSHVCIKCKSKLKSVTIQKKNHFYKKWHAVPLIWQWNQWKKDNSWKFLIRCLPKHQRFSKWTDQPSFTIAILGLVIGLCYWGNFHKGGFINLKFWSFSTRRYLEGLLSKSRFVGMHSSWISSSHHWYSVVFLVQCRTLPQPTRSEDALMDQSSLQFKHRGRKKRKVTMNLSKLKEIHQNSLTIK